MSQSQFHWWGKPVTVSLDGGVKSGRSTKKKKKKSVPKLKTRQSRHQFCGGSERTHCDSRAPHEPKDERRRRPRSRSSFKNIHMAAYGVPPALGVAPELHEAVSTGVSVFVVFSFFSCQHSHLLSFLRVLLLRSLVSYQRNFCFSFPASISSCSHHPSILFIPPRLRRSDHHHGVRLQGWSYFGG